MQASRSRRPRGPVPASWSPEGGPLNTLLQRVLLQVFRVARDTPEESLRWIAEAPSDGEVILRLLETAPALPPGAEGDPLLAARIRGYREREKLLSAEGGTLSATQVAELLHVSRQAVDKRRKVGSLLGLSVGHHGYAYPAWQFTREGVLHGLPEVLRQLRDHDPWTRAVFLLNPNGRLDGATPLQAIREGHSDRVRRIASTFGKHGAP